MIEEEIYNLLRLVVQVRHGDFATKLAVVAGNAASFTAVHVDKFSLLWRESSQTLTFPSKTQNE
jgi:hypothetical protein